MGEGWESCLGLFDWVGCRDGDEIVGVGGCELAMLRLLVCWVLRLSMYMYVLCLAVRLCVCTCVCRASFFFFFFAYRLFGWEYCVLVWSIFIINLFSCGM